MGLKRGGELLNPTRKVMRVLICLAALLLVTFAVESVEGDLEEDHAVVKRLPSWSCAATSTRDDNDNPCLDPVPSPGLTPAKASNWHYVDENTLSAPQPQYSNAGQVQLGEAETLGPHSWISCAHTETGFFLFNGGWHCYSTCPYWGGTNCRSSYRADNACFDSFCVNNEL